MRVASAIGVFALCSVLASPAGAQDLQLASLEQDDLSGLSIEELANIQVRSASKREEPLSAASAALYVITGEEIESSGATTLPEALRLAPNLSVQQVDASQYSISARGFNGLQAGNKVLALIDGRSIYTPLGSTVFWNQWWPLLEDIQQIEVISGPGGTLFGPNAVNGVINITTKDAQETLGTLVRGTAGPLERTAAVRHGFTLGESGAVRFYADWHDAEGLPAATGNPVRDDYRGWQAGFRSDFVTEADHFSLLGNIFRNNAATLPGDGARGHNVLARWSRTLSPTSSFELQTYYDRFRRDTQLVEDSVSTLDAEAQFNATVGRHDIVAGSGVRTTSDRFINELNFFQLNPTSRRLWIYNAFVQDRFRVSDELALTLGLKVERSTFTGWQVLPNARIAWQPDERNLVWAAISRAVRTPSRIDRQLEAPPFLAAAPDFESEKMVAVEAGYRGQPSDSTSLSINGFVNFYDDLRTTELFFANGLPFFQLGNGYRGKTFGIEGWGSAQVNPSWRLQLGFSTLWKDIHEKDGHVDFAPRNTLGNDPHWQIVARSDLEVAPRVQLTVNARAVGRIEQDPEIGAYVEGGGELSYQVDDHVELFVVGRNLLHKNHAESNDPEAGQFARRSVYAGARARF